MDQTEEDTRSLTEFIIHTVILALETFLTLAGNLLVCVAIYRNRRLRTLTNFYLLSLAVADIMMGTFAFPFSTVASGLGRWPFGYSYCQFLGFISSVWGQVSTVILTLVSINRYFCVVRPDKYPHYFTRKKTILSIVVVWAFTSFLTMLFSTTLVSYKWFPHFLFCHTIISDMLVERIIYLSFGCLFILPLSLTTFCYGKVYWVIKQHNNVVVPFLQGANGQRTRAQEIKSCRVLFAAVFGYFICWTPMIISSILEYGFLIPIPSSVQVIQPLFTSVSAWINPIIYGALNRAMRKEFQKLLCGNN